MSEIATNRRNLFHPPESCDDDVGMASFVREVLTATGHLNEKDDLALKVSALLLRDVPILI